jgi:S1-C subfamily serine protease
MSDESHVTSLGTADVPGAPSDGSTAEKLPVLCREAVLPKERGRGIAGVAIVCSMAGVASGLALAATLMAVQIADRSHGEQRSGCWRRSQVVNVDPRGWLGVVFVPRPDGAHVLEVMSNTPAEQVGLQAGDVIRAFNDEVIDRRNELEYLVRTAGPGNQPSLIVERQGREVTLHPILTSMPIVIRR